MKTAAKNPKAHVNELVSELSTLGRNIATDQYRVCQVLAAIKEQRLFEVLDYTGFGNFIEGEEVKIGKSAAAKWANFYSYARELGYNKSECVEILEHLSVNAAYGQLALDDKKTTVMSFVRRCRKDYLSTKYQLNVSFDDKKDLERVHKLLQKHGMVIDEATGQRTYLSESFMSMVKACK